MMTSRVVVLQQTKQLIALYTKIRDAKTTRADFIFYADRIIHLLVEESLNLLPFEPLTVTTPTGSNFLGYNFVGSLVAVSILRGGESMEFGFRNTIPGIPLGKVLIQRDESTASPKFFFLKVPKDINERYVFLLDPMLATGGSICMAISQLVRDYKVDPNKIIFVNLVAAPEGIRTLHQKFPQVQIVTGCIDSHLNEKKYIMPGLGDFGDRYFGTPDVSSKL